MALFLRKYTGGIDSCILIQILFEYVLLRTLELG